MSHIHLEKQTALRITCFPQFISSMSHKTSLTCQYCSKEFNKGEHLRVSSTVSNHLTRELTEPHRDMSGAVGCLCGSMAKSR